jgi:hemoglobin/transferrin/lactoferrin receptor protein
MVFTARAGWQINKQATLTAAVENIADKDYRIHGSGVNEPGRNFIMAVDVRF